MKTKRTVYRYARSGVREGDMIYRYRNSNDAGQYWSAAKKTWVNSIPPSVAQCIKVGWVSIKRKDALNAIKMGA